jgi:hypothetical protein
MRREKVTPKERRDLTWILGIVAVVVVIIAVVSWYNWS